MKPAPPVTIARIAANRRCPHAEHARASPPITGHAYKFRAKTAAHPGLLSGTSRTVTLRK